MLFTSESVTAGHPDKICDQISDAILDAYLSKDPDAHVAVETMATAHDIVLAGEVTSTAQVDEVQIVRDTLATIGYSKTWGYDPEKVPVQRFITTQSVDINSGVTKSLEARENVTDPFSQQGAGDQGLMFGYATDETPEMMPLTVAVAHRIAERLGDISKQVDYVGPDGKTQVTMRYSPDRRPLYVDTVLVSALHKDGFEHGRARELLEGMIREDAIIPVLNEYGLSASKILINPSGRFTVGGPVADTGLTGRKIIVDTYGGAARHGGGAFSGKDPSKVDRSGAYAMRWVAKNLVAAGLAKRCEVQVAYAIGVAEPVGVYVDSFKTGVIPDEALASIVSKVFDLRPAAIIDRLDLKRPIYSHTAAYGHFGRAGFPWEQVDMVEAIKASLRLPSSRG